MSWSCQIHLASLQVNLLLPPWFECICIDVHHMQHTMGERGPFDRKGMNVFSFYSDTNWISRRETNEEGSPGHAIQKVHSSIIFKNFQKPIYPLKTIQILVNDNGGQEILSTLYVPCTLSNLHGLFLWTLQNCNFYLHFINKIIELAIEELRSSLGVTPILWKLATIQYCLLRKNCTSNT